MKCPIKVHIWNGWEGYAESMLNLYKADKQDVVLDNGACKGDAGFYIEGFDVPTGPTSDAIGIALAQALITQTIHNLSFCAGGGKRCDWR